MRNASCHPDRKHVAKGLCNACYCVQNKLGWPNGKPADTRKSKADCHPNERHYAKGLCRACYMVSDHMRETTRARYRARPEIQVRSRLKTHYGLTLEQWDAMRSSQGGGCAICRTTTALGVDHCHASGRVRGLLCGPCNRAIGMLRDDPARARAAAVYLESGACFVKPTG